MVEGAQIAVNTVKPTKNKVKWTLVRAVLLLANVKNKNKKD